MRQLARQAGVQMTVDAGEIEGRLDLLPATPLSFLAEHTSECLAWLGQLDQSLCRFWTVAGAGTP